MHDDNLTDEQLFGNNIIDLASFYLLHLFPTDKIELLNTALFGIGFIHYIKL